MTSGILYLKYNNELIAVGKYEHAKQKNKKINEWKIRYGKKFTKLIIEDKKDPDIRSKSNYKIGIRSNTVKFKGKSTPKGLWEERNYGHVARNNTPRK